jgi:hypothetical protein
MRSQVTECDESACTAHDTLTCERQPHMPHPKAHRISHQQRASAEDGAYQQRLHSKRYSHNQTDPAGAVCSGSAGTAGWRCAIAIVGRVSWWEALLRSRITLLVLMVDRRSCSGGS